MSCKVLIYSSHPIVEVGLSFCIKKAIPGVTVLKTNSLDLLFNNKSFLNCDLFVFDVFQLSEIEFIETQITTFFKEKKIVLLIENLVIQMLQDFKNVIYINKNNTEFEIVKCIKTFYKTRKPSLRLKSVTKTIQNENKFSEREKELASLLIKGYSMSQISNELSLKRSTISTYKMRMHKKTNTKNLVQLIHWISDLRG